MFTTQFHYENAANFIHKLDQISNITHYALITRGEAHPTIHWMDSEKLLAGKVEAPCNHCTVTNDFKSMHLNILDLFNALKKLFRNMTKKYEKRAVLSLTFSERKIAYAIGRTQMELAANTLVLPSSLHPTTYWDTTRPFLPVKIMFNTCEFRRMVEGLVITCGTGLGICSIAARGGDDEAFITVSSSSSSGMKTTYEYTIDQSEWKGPVPTSVKLLTPALRKIGQLLSTAEPFEWGFHQYGCSFYQPGISAFLAELPEKWTPELLLT